MASASRQKNPLGQQILISTPPFGGLTSNTPQTVYSVVLAKGTWLVNINQIELTCDDYPTHKMNTMRQWIYYGSVVRDVSAIVGTAIYGAQLASVATIITNGTTPVSFVVNGQTSDGVATWSCDEGQITITRLF
jgi:hypothetical protein